MSQSAQSIPVEAIVASQTNPRRRFDERAMAELTESVRTHGVLQPVLLRPYKVHIESGDWGDTAAVSKEIKRITSTKMPVQWELVCGERRLRAAQAAGLAEIPGLVRELNDWEVLELQVVENLQREDLDPIDEAESYRWLLQQPEYGVDQLVARTGKSRTYIYGRLKLTELCEAAREAFWADKIDASVALLIARIPGEGLQREALQEIVEGDWDGPMSYRRAKDMVHRRFLLRLKDAPFDPRDASLVEDAGPCSKCPKRTGNQPELFDDVQSADVCTDPTCFAAKREASTARKLAEARERNLTVLDPKKAEPLFYGNGQLSYSAPYVDLKAKCDDDPKGRKWKQILGKSAPDPVVAVDNEGRVHELLPVSAAAAALKAIGLKPQNYNLVADTEAEKKRRQKEKVEEQARRAIDDAIVEATVKAVEALRFDQPKGFWAALALGAIGCAGHYRCDPVAKRRGWSAKGTRHAEAIENQLALLGDSQLAGLACELLCIQSNQRPDVEADLTKVLGLDRNAIAKAARQTVGKAKKATTKPEIDEPNEVNPEILEWLTQCPSGDINFRTNLAQANVATIRAALEDPDLKNTARTTLESRLNRLEHKPKSKRR